MTEHVFEPMRRAMVASQLRTTGVNDPRVVEAMGEVPREDFVPPERLALAYADAQVPLVPGRALNPPMALGRLLTEARLRGHERALVVGAATGYAPAGLAPLGRAMAPPRGGGEVGRRAGGGRRAGFAGGGVAPPGPRIGRARGG